MSNDLLHEALRRATIRTAHEDGNSNALSPPLGSNASATSSDGGHDSDDETYTPVHTRPGTPTHGLLSPRKSRNTGASSASAAGSAAGSRSSSPSRMAKRRMQEEAERRASRDPLKRFENEISSRIFRELDVRSLARALRVSKRWNRSATINWAWYLRFQEQREDGSLSREPVWTRRESKENWPRRFRSAFTLNGLQYATAFEMDYEKARSDGYRTPREEREAKWAAETQAVFGNTPAAPGEEGSSIGSLRGTGIGYSGSSRPSSAAGGGGSGIDRSAAREYYKSLGGRTKTKGKAGGSTGPRDLTAFGDGGGDDDY